VQSIMAALRKGADTAEFENRVREMRMSLQLLQSQSRKLVRAAYGPRSRPATAAIAPRPLGAV
jgi:hypothetical protein